VYYIGVPSSPSSDRKTVMTVNFLNTQLMGWGHPHTFGMAIIRRGALKTDQNVYLSLRVGRNCRNWYWVIFTLMEKK